MVASWLVTLAQQFGRDIITGAPGALEAIQREYKVAKNPYVDKHAYWFRRGGEAERDADDHRLYDNMTQDQKMHLADLQASGSWPPFESYKPKHRRPWTGAFASTMPESKK